MGQKHLSHVLIPYTIPCHIERSDNMKKVINIFNKFEEYLLVGSLVLNVIIVFIQVIMRYFFNFSLTWAEELSRYIFIWYTWLGTSIALKENQHIKVELIFSFIKNKKAKRAIKVTANLIWFAFSLFLAYNGFKLTQSMIHRNALSSGMMIPLAFIYISLPISSVLICLRLIGVIFADIKNEEKPVNTNVTAKGGNV